MVYYGLRRWFVKRYDPDRIIGNRDLNRSSGPPRMSVRTQQHARDTMEVSPEVASILVSLSVRGRIPVIGITGVVDTQTESVTVECASG